MNLRSVTPNWTGWKTVKLVLTVVGGLATTFATTSAFDALGPAVSATVHSVASTVGQLDATALAVVIFLSGTSAGPTVQKKAA